MVFYYYREFVDDLNDSYSDGSGSMDATEYYLWICLLSFANGMVLVVMDEIYKFLSTIIVNWENHKHETDRENSLILKNYMFQFMNSYITLFYYSFIQRDFDVVASSMATTMIGKQVLNVAISSGLPWLKWRIRSFLFWRKYKEYREEKLKEIVKHIFTQELVIGDWLFE